MEELQGVIMSSDLFRRYIDIVKENQHDPANAGEYDREGEMAQQDLTTAADAAEELRDILDADENLPEWVQSKITKAVDYLDTARDYMKSEKQDVEENSIRKTFLDYVAEEETTFERPRTGDNFSISCREECLLETWVCDETDDGIVLYADDRMMSLLDGYGYLNEENANLDEGYLDNTRDGQGVDEAKYQGREVPLGKPMAGDVKKSKVYVRGPKGNVVKVNFGQKGMKIKKNIPARRKNFRARHNCDNPGPRWKARYWSCRAW